MKDIILHTPALDAGIHTDNCFEKSLVDMS